MPDKNLFKKMEQTNSELSNKKPTKHLMTVETRGTIPTLLRLVLIYIASHSHEILISYIVYTLLVVGVYTSYSRIMINCWPTTYELRRVAIINSNKT